MNRRFLPILGALALLAFPGCSIKKIAINSLGNALASGGSTYAEDDDPDLVREAVPFGLKTIEGLLAESPRHRGLLLAAASGFTQYGYAFIQQEATHREPRPGWPALGTAAASITSGRSGQTPGLGWLPSRRPPAKGPRKPFPAPANATSLLYWTGLAWAQPSPSQDSELTADQYVGGHHAPRSRPRRGTSRLIRLLHRLRGGRQPPPADRWKRRLERALFFARGGRRLVTYAGRSRSAGRTGGSSRGSWSTYLAIDANQARLRLQRRVRNRRVGSWKEPANSSSVRTWASLGGSRRRRCVRSGCCPPQPFLSRPSPSW
jgi:hypothetical protein